MQLNEIKVDGFRNLTNVVCHPHEKMNVFYGNNAQGKTNLILSILLFTGLESSLNTKESKLIHFDRDRACVSIVFEDDERENDATIHLAKKNKITLNRVEKKGFHALTGAFLAVCFTPSQMNILKGSPKERRKMVDEGVLQIKPVYQKYIGEYKRVLLQRNALLKQASALDEKILSVWDRQLAKLGTIITLIRKDYIRRLDEKTREIYQEISSYQEKMHLHYQSTVFEDIQDYTYDEDKVELYYQALLKKREEDREQGFTTIGIHRDELETKVNDFILRHYGSQGQIRSGMLAIRLAQANIMKEITGQNPIILLDDVMSELDKTRQEYILNHLHDCQTFITCCDRSNMNGMKQGKVFYIQKGEVKGVT